MRTFTLWLVGLTLVLTICVSPGFLCIMIPILFLWFCFLGQLL